MQWCARQPEKEESMRKSIGAAGRQQQQIIILLTSFPFVGGDDGQLHRRQAACGDLITTTRTTSIT